MRLGCIDNHTKHVDLHPLFVVSDETDVEQNRTGIVQIILDDES